MRSVSVRLSDLDKITIPIGFVGENLYTSVIIDCKEVFDKHPLAIPALTVTPPHGDSYPAVTTREGNLVTWVICDSDLVYKGNGEIQLSFVDDEIIGKTYCANTRILRSIEPTGSAPTPIANWLITANEKLTEVSVIIEELPATVASEVSRQVGDLIDDTAGTGVTDKTWSADKLVTEFGKKADRSEIPVISVATVAETEEIIREYGAGSSMIAEMEFYTDGGVNAGFRTIDDASSLASAFLNGDRVLLHIPAVTGHASYYPDNREGYLELIGYEPSYVDNTVTYPACFIVSGGSGANYDMDHSAIHFLYRTSVDVNGKLCIEIYAD